ncbi:MAG: NIF family HAD-type phosphatase [Saprospiraceae bacterium]
MKSADKILLILDLDETLIFATEQQLERKADFIVFDYYVYKRPYLDEFLAYAQTNFIVAIWSSASDDYVMEIVKNIIPTDYPLAFVWGNSRCTYRRNFYRDEGYIFNDSNRHYHFVKPLKKVRRRGYDLKRILIVDDTPHKSQDNYGNAIYPSEYKGDLQDDELGKLERYLTTLQDKINVRRIEKRNWRSQI